MKTATFTLFLAFAIMICGVEKAEAQSINWKKFFGEWNKNNEEKGEYFILNFKNNADTLSEISYSVMGPFEEILSGKLISNTKAELYFDYIVGSISFNKIAGKDDATLKECRKKKVADCTINSDGTMTLQTYYDKCGQLPQSTKIILRKSTDIAEMVNNNDENTTNEIQKIRTQYYELKSQIENKTNDLVCLYLEDNKFDQRKPGTRYYNEKTYFYYTPDYKELKMVILEGQNGIQSFYEEYMFNGESLVFAFEQQNEDKNSGKRLYQQDDKTVKYSVGNNDKNIAENEDKIAMLNKKAFQLLRIFNSYMLRD